MGIHNLQISNRGQINGKPIGKRIGCDFKCEFRNVFNTENTFTNKLINTIYGLSGSGIMK